MAYEMKPDSGSLFKNDRREKDTHANAKGTALIGGVEYWVDAWTNESSNGTKYQSLKFKRKDGGGGQRNEPSNGAGWGADDDSDVPF